MSTSSASSAETSFLATVTGPDRRGVAARLFDALVPLGAPVLDVEQVQVHGRLLLCVEVRAPADREEAAGDACRASATIERALRAALAGLDGLEVTVAPWRSPSDAAGGPRHLVTVLAQDMGAEALAGVCGQVAGCGGNIERIGRLSTYPVTSYELEVSGADPARLRRGLVEGAARMRIDVAVQRAGLHRRAKHLIVLDADSTLLQGEAIDLLAQRAGRGEEVAALTASAMGGEIDFAEALARRVELLAGLDVAELAQVAEQLALAPGARTLVRTLRRLGYVTAVVSGGFSQVVRPIAEKLGIDHVAANTLEVADGRVTGRLAGPVVDRAGKAEALVRFAGEAGVPLSRTVAVGDGANDLDMLAAAGLGIAFNAKPLVRSAADASLSVPYLDAILFLLGIARHEVEAADRSPDP